jgi:hypothetical protein
MAAGMWTRTRLAQDSSELLLTEQHISSFIYRVFQNEHYSGIPNVTVW